MRRVTGTFAGIILIIGLTACGSKTEHIQSETEQPMTNEVSTTESALQEETESSETVVTTETASQEPEISFEDLDIFSFELMNRDDESYDEVISSFMIKNNSTYTIDYCTVDFIYKDKDGNIICDDSRYHDCRIESGKSAYITSYSSLPSNYEKSDIAVIEVSSYDYVIGEQEIDIDVENNSFTAYEISQDQAASFDDANILSFEYNDIGIDSIDAYEVEVKVINNGKSNIKTMSYKIAYFDSEGNYLDSDGRYVDNTINPGNFAISNSFMDNEDLSSMVDSYCVYAYDYELSSPDERGFTSYEVNIQTGKAKAW